MPSIPGSHLCSLTRALVVPGIAFGSIAGILTQPAVAQEATPPPVVCDVEPRSEEFVVDLVEQPDPEITPVPLTGVPEGTNDVDPEARAAVIAVVEKVTACVNQGELLRAFALFDTAYLRRVIDPEGLMSERVALELGRSFATPRAIDESERTVLEEIMLVRELPDGSVAVVFRTRGGPDRDPDHVQVDMFIMRETDGEWLIVDGLTNLDPANVPVQ